MTKVKASINSNNKQLAKMQTRYVVDTRPLCQGMPFVLTDQAHPRLVLKHGGNFLVMDQSASIPDCNTLGYGYYRNDTRYLSRWEMYLNDFPMSLLSSDTEKGFSGSFLYTNLAMGTIPQQKITIRRSLVLDDFVWERLELENYSYEEHDVQLQLKFYSDFADMFEVRGLNRPQRGERMVPTAGDDNSCIFLAYRGLDGSLLETVIEFPDLKPETIADGMATFHLKLPFRKPIHLELCVAPKWDGQYLATSDPKVTNSDALQVAEEKHRTWRRGGADIKTEHDLVNLALQRGFRDIYILRQATPKGFGIAAGIPWYGTVFGRDSIITSWQMLPFHVEIARETLTVLAAYQGTKNDTWKEESPGKIMHELRVGELARASLIPHSPYYGTVDATPLWLMLLCEYVKWTGDLEFAHKLWPAVKLALQWLEKEINEGSGYLTYKRIGEHGLENQGWKDSGDAIMHVDGTLAIPPIALCEVQGYLYAAQIKTSELAYILGHKSLAEKLSNEAAKLKQRFQKDFWMSEAKYVALALDGKQNQVAVISSNPGHCLWTNILDDDKAQAVADRLMSNDMHSGWGIRTLSSNTVAFNPIGYHTGTVWPHDNAIIGEGMRNLGRLEDTHKILRGLLEVSQHYPGYRLPELFAGFGHNYSERPIDYPVSCSPQAWAAGSIFQTIASCINFQPDALNNMIKIVNPALPEWLGKVVIRELHIGQSVIDVALQNNGTTTFCQVLRKIGPVKIIIEN